MAGTILHSDLTAGDLHEPKGAGSAVANTVYVANGLGSGSWKKAYTKSIEDYNHSGSAVALTAGVWTKLTNNGTGVNTNTGGKIPGFSDKWDTVNNQFDWDDLALYDTVDIRFDITFTTSGANVSSAIRLKVGVGDADVYYLPIISSEHKTAGTHQVVVLSSLYMGNTTTLDFPTEVEVMSDSSSTTVLTNGWAISCHPRNPVYV